MIKVRENGIHIETSTLWAIIEKGALTSLKSRADGEEFIVAASICDQPVLHLVYGSGGSSGVGESRFGSVEYLQISDTCAEIRCGNWDGDGVITILEDAGNGDLIIEPSAYSSRPGVRSVRWDIRGIRRDLEMVAPFFQGVRLKMDDPLIMNSRWNWPSGWEAGLVILQGKQGGFWVHTRDEKYRYKALKVGTESDAFCLGFETEAYGPVYNNLCAGGLAWRINTYKGGWEVPAEEYRNWLWRAYNLKEEESRRADWSDSVRMAVSWCPGDVRLLDALAKKTDPRKVLIHFSDWRKDGYDKNYPSYHANERARIFLEKGREMGFHIMPHCNALEVDPGNPAYNYVRDFQYRDIETGRIHGWSWVDGDNSLDVPDSNAQLDRHRDKNLIIKIHPGLKMWRHILGKSILKAAEELSLDAVFIDVTLTTYNIHNCLVENMTPTEGVRLLINHVCNLANGLTVGGEGMNEITMQGQSFAQVHLFRSWQKSVNGLERTGGCPLNAFLFGKLCRSFGYSGLGGRNESEELRMKIDESRGVIPTVTFGWGSSDPASEVENPNRAVKRVFELANI